MEQYNRKDDVIIHGVPEEEDKDIRQKFRIVGEKFGVKLGNAIPSQVQVQAITSLVDVRMYSSCSYSQTNRQKLQSFALTPSNYVFL